MKPEEAIETFKYLLVKFDYKDLPDIAQTFHYAIRAIESRERMREALEKISEQRGGNSCSCKIMAKSALAEAEKEK